MLRKLMKHELRATGRVMGPMLLFVLVAAVGGNISTYRLLETSNGVLNTLGVVLLMVFTVAFAASGIVAFCLMVQRFYKNLLRDEGYLTMTLPVSVHEHIWAKLLTSLIWWAAVLAVAIAAMCILVFNVGVADAIREILSQLDLGDARLWENVPHALGFCLELALVLAVGGAGVCLHFYAALAIGQSFTHHKDALSIAGFFVLPAAMSALHRLVTPVLHLLGWPGISVWLQSLPQMTQMHLTMLIAAAVAAVPAALYYALTAYFLKNRLNLS